MNIQTLPLDSLCLSPRNVRKTGGVSIESLAASIAAHGLIQNLTVSPAANGTYEVEAGSRRFRALQYLRQNGQIADDYGVSCHVLEAEAGQLAEVSLAENVIRQAMHPADEFDAIAHLVQGGATIGEISLRFGQPPLFVKQRLKLANVAPEIIADYRAGDATLEQMMALALTDDQALQLRIWKGTKGWQRDPDRLRQQITAKETSVNSKLGKFVGLEAYEKAGGSVRRDLFGEDVYLQDAELLEQLAQAKLERTAEKIRKEGWSWVESRTDFSYGDQSAFGHAACDYKGKKKTWSADVMAHAGVVVSIGYSGQMEVERGLVRPQDRKAVAKATGSQVEGGKAKAERKPGEFSLAAVQRLQAEATGILRAEIAELPRTALALLAAEMAGRELYDFTIDYGAAQRRWVHVTREASGRMNGGIRVVMEQSPAGQRFDAVEATWRERLPNKKADLRAFLLLQDFDFITKLLAFLSARELDVVDIEPDQKQGVTDVAEAAQVDLSQHWAPTEEWLATLPKAVVIAMVTDAAGAAAAAPLAKLKSNQVPHEAIALLPAGWLPTPLRGAKKAQAPAAKAKPKKAAAKKPAKKLAKKPSAKKAAKASAKKSRKAGAK